MSLEIALAENTSAIQRLAELFAAFMAGPTGGATLLATDKPTTKKAEKPAKTESAAEAPGKPEASTPTSQASPTTASATAPAAETKAADKVTYQMARELVLKLAATHRDAIKAVNTKHGIAKLSALLEDEADFFSVTDQAKLEAVYADLATLG